MKPEEKAEELIQKFGTYAVMWSGGIEVERENVKQCALICVDEILKTPNGYKTKPLNIECFNEYWQEVKSIIEGL